MMRRTLWGVGIFAVLATLFLVACDEAGTSIDLTGVFKTVPGTTQWNAEGSQYWRSGFYSQYTFSAWDEQASGPSFLQVAAADDTNNSRVFLRATQAYGTGRWNWRIYDEDPITGVDNGFEVSDTVDISVRVWVPDLDVQTVPDGDLGSSTAVWFMIHAAGEPKEITSTSAPGWTSDDLLVRYDNMTGFCDGNDCARGTGGWITLVKEDVEVLDAGGGVGVIDIRVSTGNQNNNPVAPYVAYFDYIRVTRQDP